MSQVTKNPVVIHQPTANQATTKSSVTEQSATAQALTQQPVTTKSEFLSLLYQRISGLPQDDISRSLDYYSEIIEDRMEDGLTEAEAIAAIGSMDEIASQIVGEIPLPKLVKSRVKPNRTFQVWEFLLLLLGSPLWLSLLFAAILILISIYLVLWSVIAVLYAVDFSFAAAAIGGIIKGVALVFSGNPIQGIFFLGTGLICIGVTILLFLGSKQMTKTIISLLKKMLSMIKECLMKKELRYERKEHCMD